MSNAEKTLNVFKKNVSLEKIKRDENTIHITDENSYFISYIEFVKYFSNLKKINKHNVIIGINFTYGWMPTIFDFRSDNLNEATKILNQAKQGKRPTLVELEILKKCFNNSLVGTSKLLHFINPNTFAIWDSRVFRYLTKEEPYSYKLNNSKSYLDYLDFCAYLTKNPEYNKIHKSMIKKIGYPTTKFRTLELIMFEAGKK